MSVFDALPPGPVEPLTCKKTTGEPYQRSAAVERQIGGLLGIPESEWQPKLRHAYPETLVHLIRCARRRALGIYQELFSELSKRITRLALQWAKGLPASEKQDAVADVVCEIMELAVSLERTRHTEFLEVAFIPAVQSRTVDKFRSFERNSEHRDSTAPEQFSEDDSNIERPMEYAPDESPNPETLVIMRQLVDRAFAAMKNKKQAKAVYLFYVEGWPVYSADRDEPCLCRLFRKTPRVIHYWIDQGTAAMRQALAAVGVRGTADLSIKGKTGVGESFQSEAAAIAVYQQHSNGGPDAYKSVGGPFDSEEAALAVYRQDSNGGPDANKGAKK